MGDFYLQYEYWIAVIQLVLAMLGMGATLTLNDFREILIEPKAVTSGLAIQILLIPIIAFLFIQATGFVGGIAGGLAVGIALIATIPGGATSNIFTHFARGNIALSISITAITTLACLLTIPFILDLLISEYMPDSFVMPRGRIMSEIAFTLLLPLVLGMIYLRLFPSTAEAFSKWSIRASLVGILVIVVGSLSSGRLDTDAFGVINLASILALMAAFALSSWTICRALRLSSFDSTAINMEVVVRNVNLGLMIKASLFPAVIGQPDAIGDTVLFALLAYGGMQLIMAAVLIAVGRRNGQSAVSTKATELGAS